MNIYLYKKTHRITGLNYLGQTSQDPFKYTGSGKYWSLHLKKHGNDVNTEILKECKSHDEIKTWGIYYSELWNIVESEEWANMKLEEGDGWSSATATELQNRPEIKKKKSDSLKKFWENADTEKRDQHSRRIKLALDNQQAKEKKAIARAKQTGMNAPKVNKRIYEFQHKDGSKESCTQLEMSLKYSLSGSHLSNLINHPDKHKSVKGWKLI